MATPQVRVETSSDLLRSRRSLSQSLQQFRKTYRVTLLPSPAGTETKTCEHRPRPAFEEQDREDHTERRAEGAADKESAEAVVPLQDRILAIVLRRVHMYLQRPYSFSSKSPCAIPTFSFKRASLMGLLGRTAAAVMGALELESAIVKVVFVVVELSRESSIAL